MEKRTYVNPIILGTGNGTYAPGPTTYQHNSKMGKKNQNIIPKKINVLLDVY